MVKAQLPRHVTQLGFSHASPRVDAICTSWAWMTQAAGSTASGREVIEAHRLSARFPFASTVPSTTICNCLPCHGSVVYGARDAHSRESRRIISAFQDSPRVRPRAKSQDRVPTPQSSVSLANACSVHAGEHQRLLHYVAQVASSKLQLQGGRKWGTG